MERQSRGYLTLKRDLLFDLFFKTYQKYVTGLILVCFSVSSLIPPQAWAQPQDVSSEGSPIEISFGEKTLDPSFVPLGIPQELASIEEVYIPDGGEKLASPLIHVQSVHSHGETQKKIYELLKFLDQKYGIARLFIEGAVENLNPDYFRFFDENRLNVRVAERLVEKGELTGAELFLVESEKKVPAYGLEESGLYRANLSSFQSVMLQRPVTSAFMKQTEGVLDRLESLILTPVARKLARASKSFDAGQMELLSYVLDLERNAKETLGLDLRRFENQTAWPQLIRLLMLQEIESDLDPEKIQLDRERLVGFMREAKIDPSLLGGFERLSFSPYQTGMVYDPGFRKSDLPRYLAERLVEATLEKGFSFDQYPAFTRFLEASVLQSELDPERLFGEMERLYEKLVESVSSKEEERKLVELVQEEGLHERLFDLELTPKDYSKVEALNQIERPLVRFLLNVESLHEKTTLGPKKLVPANIELLETVYGEAVRFYALAKQREETMVSKITASPSPVSSPPQGERIKGTSFPSPQRGEGQGEGVTVLITGGFHADGLSRAFRKKRIPYTLLSPRITQKVSTEAYVASLLGEKKTAFDVAYLEPVIGSQGSGAILGQLTEERGNNEFHAKQRTALEAEVAVASEEKMAAGRFVATHERRRRALPDTTRWPELRIDDKNTIYPFVGVDDPLLNSGNRPFGIKSNRVKIVEERYVPAPIPQIVSREEMPPAPPSRPTAAPVAPPRAVPADAFGRAEVRTGEKSPTNKWKKRAYATAAILLFGTGVYIGMTDNPFGGKQPQGVAPQPTPEQPAGQRPDKMAPNERMTQTDYERVANTGDVEAVKAYIKRFYRIRNEGSLSGFAPHYTKFVEGVSNPEPGKHLGAFPRPVEDMIRELDSVAWAERLERPAPKQELPEKKVEAPKTAPKTAVDLAKTVPVKDINFNELRRSYEKVAETGDVEAVKTFIRRISDIRGEGQLSGFAPHYTKFVEGVSNPEPGKHLGDSPRPLSDLLRELDDSSWAKVHKDTPRSEGRAGGQEPIKDRAPPVKPVQPEQPDQKPETPKQVLPKTDFKATQETIGFFQKHIGGVGNYITDPQAGVHGSTGALRDHVRLDAKGDVVAVGDYGSPSKDGVYLPTLVLIYQQNPMTRQIKMSPDEALDRMLKNLQSLRQFQKDYEGKEVYGGLFPWYELRRDGTRRLTQYGGRKMVPSLDNGQTTLGGLAAVAGALWDAPEGSKARQVRDLALEVLRNQDYKKWVNPRTGRLYAEWSFDQNRGVAGGGEVLFWTEWSIPALYAYLNGDMTQEGWLSQSNQTFVWDSPAGRLDMPQMYRFSAPEHWIIQYLGKTIMKSKLAPLYLNTVYARAQWARDNNIPGFSGVEYRADGTYVSSGPRLKGLRLLGPIEDDQMATPYGTGLDMIIHPPTAEWTRYLLEQPGMETKYGFPTSFTRKYGASTFYTGDNFTTLNSIAEWYSIVTGQKGGINDAIVNYWSKKWGVTFEEAERRIIQAFDLHADAILKRLGRGQFLTIDPAKIPGPPEKRDYSVEKQAEKTITEKTISLSSRLQGGHWHSESATWNKGALREGEIVADYNMAGKDYAFVGTYLQPELPIAGKDKDGKAVKYQSVSVWVPSDLDEAAKEVWNKVKAAGSIEEIRKMSLAEFAAKVGIKVIPSTNVGRPLFTIGTEMHERLEKYRKGESLTPPAPASFRSLAPIKEITGPGIYLSPEDFDAANLLLRNEGSPARYNKATIVHELMEEELSKRGAVNPILHLFRQHTDPRVLEEELLFSAMLGGSSVRETQAVYAQMMEVENQMLEESATYFARIQKQYRSGGYDKQHGALNDERVEQSLGRTSPYYQTLRWIISQDLKNVSRAAQKRWEGQDFETFVSRAEVREEKKGISGRGGAVGIGPTGERLQRSPQGPTLSTEAGQTSTSLSPHSVAAQNPSNATTMMQLINRALNGIVTWAKNSLAKAAANATVTRFLQVSEIYFLRPLLSIIQSISRLFQHVSRQVGAARLSFIVPSTSRAEVRTDEAAAELEKWRNRARIGALLNHTLNNNLTALVGFLEFGGLGESRTALTAFRKFAGRFNDPAAVFYRIAKNPGIIVLEDTAGYASEQKEPVLNTSELARQADFAGIFKVLDEAARQFEADITELEKPAGKPEEAQKITERVVRQGGVISQFAADYLKEAEDKVAELSRAEVRGSDDQKTRGPETVSGVAADAVTPPLSQDGAQSSVRLPDAGLSRGHKPPADPARAAPGPIAGFSGSTRDRSQAGTPPGLLPGSGIPSPGGQGRTSRIPSKAPGFSQIVPDQSLSRLLQVILDILRPVTPEIIFGIIERLIKSLMEKGRFVNSPIGVMGVLMGEPMRRIVSDDRRPTALPEQFDLNGKPRNPSPNPAMLVPSTNFALEGDNVSGLPGLGHTGGTIPPSAVNPTRAEVRAVDPLKLTLPRESDEFRLLIGEAIKVFRDLGQPFATSGMLTAGRPDESKANLRLILGSQDLRLFPEAVEKFKQPGPKTPLIISGGRGRGTPGLEAALKEMAGKILSSENLKQALTIKDVSEAQLIEALFKDLGVGPGTSTDIPVFLEKESKSTYQNLEFIVRILKAAETPILPPGEKPRIVIYVTEAQVARTVSAMIHRLRLEGLNWEFMVTPAYQVDLVSLPDPVLLDFLFKSIGLPGPFATGREFTDPPYAMTNTNMDEAQRIVRDTNKTSTQYPRNTVETEKDNAFPGGRFNFGGGTVTYQYGPDQIKQVRDGLFLRLLEKAAPPRAEVRTAYKNAIQIFQDRDEDGQRALLEELQGILNQAAGKVEQGGSERFVYLAQLVPILQGQAEGLFPPPAAEARLKAFFESLAIFKADFGGPEFAEIVRTAQPRPVFLLELFKALGIEIKTEEPPTAETPERAPRAEVRRDQRGQLVTSKEKLEEILGQARNVQTLATESGTILTGQIVPAAAVVGRVPVIAPRLLVPRVMRIYQSRPVKSPQIALLTALALFKRDGVSRPLIDVLFMEDRAVAEAHLEFYIEAVKQSLGREIQIEAVLNEAFSQNTRPGALMRKRTDVPGAHAVVLDHAPSREELAAILLPAIMNKNLFVEILFTPEAGVNEQSVQNLLKEARKLIDDKKERVVFLPSSPTWEHFEETLADTGRRLHTRMAKEVSVPLLDQFIDRHVVVSVQENLWNKSPKIGEGLGKKTQTVLYAFDVNDPNYVPYLGGEALLASKLAQDVLSLDQKRFLTPQGGRRYRVTGDSLAEFVASLQTALEGLEQIFASA